CLSAGAAGVGQVGAGKIEHAIHQLAAAADQRRAVRVATGLIDQDALVISAGGRREIDGGAALHVDVAVFEVDGHAGSAEARLGAEIDIAADVVGSGIQIERRVRGQVPSAAVGAGADGLGRVRTKADCAIAGSGSRGVHVCEGVGEGRGAELGGGADAAAAVAAADNLGPGVAGGGDGGAAVHGDCLG